MFAASSRLNRRTREPMFRYERIRPPCSVSSVGRCGVKDCTEAGSALSGEGGGCEPGGPAGGAGALGAAAPQAGGGDRGGVRGGRPVLLRAGQGAGQVRD